jgi:hypothetical protein
VSENGARIAHTGLGESFEFERVANGSDRRFVSFGQVRIAGRDRHRSPVVRDGAAVVARSSIGAGERREQIAVLAGVQFGALQDLQRFLPGVSPRQRRTQTDTRVDIRGMLENDCAKSSLGFLCSSHAELQSRDPQPDLDVDGILHDDPLEDGKRFDGSS